MTNHQGGAGQLLEQPGLDHQVVVDAVRAIDLSIEDAF